MLSRIAKAWWGDFSADELRKFSLLAVIFGVIIGVYWLLRPLKDSIFMSVVGENYIPKAKFLSLFVVFSSCTYLFQTCRYVSSKMFYALCTIYGLAALAFAFIMFSPVMGLSNTVASPDRWWGWVWYVFVESFGSLVVALFWAFAADTTTPESAEKGYPLVAFGGQLGNILGPLFLGTIVQYFTHFELGPEGQLPAEAVQQSASVHAGMVGLAAVGIFAIMGLVWFFMRVVPLEQLIGYHGTNETKEEEPGFFEGLKLIFSSPYLLGIAGIITAYEVIVTVLDFNFKTLVKLNYPEAHASTIYLSSYGTWVGIISLLSIALRINKVQQLLGLGAALASLPLLIAVVVLSFKAYPIIGVLFWIMVLSKAVNYALNQPSMKQLYIPTTREAKYKSQAFIEMYGSRGSKALGSSVNLMRKPLMDKMGSVAGLSYFIALCTYVSLGIVGFWFFIALYLGRTYRTAIEKKQVVI